MKSIFFAVTTLGLVSVLAGAESPVEDISRDPVVTGASVQKWLSRIPEGSEALYGFSSRAEFERATTARPVRMASISPAAVLENRPKGRIELMRTWRVPVLVDGEYRALLTVVGQDDGFRIVEIGAARLAAELGDMTGQGIGAAGDMLLVRIFQLRSDFLLAGDALSPEKGVFYPLQSARTYLGLGTAVKMDHREVIEAIEPYFERFAGSP